MMLGRLGAHPETLRARGSAAGRSTRRLARVWEGGRGQDSVALTAVAAGARAAGRPPPGSPGLPPHVPASWQGAWVSDTSLVQRRSAWRPDHTSGTPEIPWPSPSASAARIRRSRRSDTRRWPRNSPGKATVGGVGTGTLFYAHASPSSREDRRILSASPPRRVPYLRGRLGAARKPGYGNPRRSGAPNGERVRARA